MNRTNGHLVVAQPRDDRTAAAHFADDAHRAVSTALKRSMAAGLLRATQAFQIALCAVEQGQAELMEEDGDG